MEFDTNIMYNLAVIEILENASNEQFNKLLAVMKCDVIQDIRDLAKYLLSHVSSYVDDNYIIHIKPDDWFYPQFKVANMEMLLFIAENLLTQKISRFG